MNRTEFEALRDIPAKIIRADIRFARRIATAPALIADNIIIENAAKPTSGSPSVTTQKSARRRSTRTSRGSGPFVASISMDHRIGLPGALTNIRSTANVVPTAISQMESSIEPI